MTTNEQIRLFSDVAGAFVMQWEYDAAQIGWSIITPEESIYFETQAELMQHIKSNLDIMERVYTDAGEVQEWREFVERAKA